MKFRYIGLFVFTAIFTFCGCNPQSFGMIEDMEMMHINRFDKALFQWIETDQPTTLEQVKSKYPQMFDMLGKALFQTDDTNTATYNDLLINYYSEPTLKSLYQDAITFYASGSSAVLQIEQELSEGFARFTKLFPAMQIPAVYMHVSGLQQNMIVADSLLSCSIDKYMGVNYPLYEDFFYDYQRKNMTPARIPIDALSVWLQSEYPYQGKENVLLERMIYEGKIIYVLMKIGRAYSYQNMMSLTDDEYKWCKEYEKTLWTTMIERQHLFTPDIATTMKYFQPTPSAFIAEAAPGNLGNFIGYRIVERYMKQTKSSCEDLMKNNDAQDILQKSKYKP